MDTSADDATSAVAYVERSFLPRATIERSTAAKLKLEKYYESLILQLSELDKRCGPRRVAVRARAREGELTRARMPAGLSPARAGARSTPRRSTRRA